MPETIDVFKNFRLNLAAFRYFGIICFEDMPGYFPQLGKTDEQDRNLKGHVAAVVCRKIATRS